MEGNGQLDDAEVGAEVSAGFGNDADEFIADFPGEKREVGLGNGTEIGGGVDAGEDGSFVFGHGGLDHGLHGTRGAGDAGRTSGGGVVRFHHRQRIPRGSRGRRFFRR